MGCHLHCHSVQMTPNVQSLRLLPMKLIMYVSKVSKRVPSGHVVPAELAKIMSQSRTQNRTHNVTGTLCYKRGRYLQVIEGEQRDVDELFDKITQDPRHKNVANILDTPITQRFFSNSMKLISSAEKDLDFSHFIKKQSSTILAMPRVHQHALSFFYNLNELESQPSSGSPEGEQEGKADVLKTYRLSLTRWPDFNAIEPEPSILDLCARLLKSAHTFNELKSDPSFEDDRQLEKILLRLDKLGVLEKQPASEGRVVESYPVRPATSFYQKMSRFLGRI